MTGPAITQSSGQSSSPQQTGTAASSCGQTFGDNQVGPVQPCPKRLFNARWEEETVKCGDNAHMLADTENIAANLPATYTVKKTVDDGTVASVSSTTAASSVNRGTWLSKKATSTWNGAEEKFTVAADGLTDSSHDPQLSFHRYPDIARQSITHHLTSPPGASPRFGWDEKVFIEFADRKVILTVKVHLKNRTQNRPERGKSESYSDYYARCEALPIGGPVTGSGKEKHY